MARSCSEYLETSAVDRKVIYEHPLNERTRVFLRLEHLLEQTHHHLQGSSIWDTRGALNGLLDIINLLGRADLKTEIIKELERHSKNLSRMASLPGVDATRLSQVLTELDRMNEQFLASKGQIVATLKRNEFLASIQQRSSIPGGTCEFDLPELHHWLTRSDIDRQRLIRSWLGSIGLFTEAIGLVLQLTRNSASSTNEMAERGNFQRNLDPNLPAQLIRVTLNTNSTHYPEVSGGKHRFSIRFMSMLDEERCANVDDDVPFELTCCII